MRTGPATLAMLAAAVVMTVACVDGTPRVAGGTHVDGLRHGLWRIAHPDGSIEEGCYVAGRLHGEWVLRDPAGRIVAREHWYHGRAASSQGASGEDDPCGPGSPGQFM